MIRFPAFIFLCLVLFSFRADDAYNQEIQAFRNGVWVTFGEHDQFLNPYPLNSRGISILRDEEWDNKPFDSLLGMRELNKITINPENPNQVFLGAGLVQGTEYAENIANRIDEQVFKILNYCEQKAIEIIRENRVVIDLIVEKLLDAETMDGSEFRKIVSNYTLLPNKNLPYISKFN